jgi:hypothetical protein
MEADISCITGTPGSFRITVERPLWTLERRERLARIVAVNFDRWIDLDPRVWLVPPGWERKDGWSLSGGAPGCGDASAGRSQDRFNLVRIVPAAAHNAGDGHPHLFRSRLRGLAAPLMIMAGEQKPHWLPA